jgi:uncharacterized protein YciI
MKLIFTLFFAFGSYISIGQSKTYTFVFLHKKNDAAQLEKEESEKIMKGHMANITRLSKEGKLLVAGPFDGGGGIFIFNTTSLDEARDWLSTDPGVQANRWNLEIILYEPTIGSVCVAKEPYEMVTYNFVRFTVNPNQSTKDMLDEHTQYIRNLDNVVTAGNFGSAGSILITSSENDVADAPAVKNGLITAERKKLWIAKGSFCEK